jgi:dienelactone hydrolase
MELIDEKVVDGVVCRRFDLAVEGQVVPGRHWLPEGGTGPRPTILMGHGGFQSKEAPNIVAMAERFARERGFATVALDAPGHGDRRTEEQIRQQEETLRRLRREGAGSGGSGRGAGARPSSPSEDREPRMVREWKALLDELEGEPESAGGPYGYWGVSMGARYGIPLVATEPRIQAAVFGLFGYLPDETFRAQVAAISVPLLFLFQYDDELMTPEAGLALWKAFGSTEKTMHINPGPHVGIPVFERDSSLAFFVRHLAC